VEWRPGQAGVIGLGFVSIPRLEQEENDAMKSLKVFMWWFVVGAMMALSVIMLQGGIQQVMQARGPLWDVKLVELFTPIMGGGLLGGCIALILDRIRKP
jgi:hypothetical protein